MIKFNILIGNYFKSNYSTFINAVINKNSDNVIKGKEKMSIFLNKLNEMKTKFNDGGGDRARNRQIQLKKLLVNERINILFEKDKYFEIGQLAGYGQDYGDIPKGGCVCAIGYVNKRLCVFYASDATVKGGSIYPIQLKKHQRLHDIAMNLSLPLICLNDTGGAFLPLQADIFPEYGGRIFYNQAILESKGIPLITVTCGQCTAGGAYLPVMSTENGIVRTSGQFFLAGPPLVFAATGELYLPDDLGGAELHNKISGCSDYLFESELEGLSNVKDFISSLPQQHIDCQNFENPIDPLFSSDELNWLTLNFGVKDEESRNFMMQILARILDGSCFHEFKSEYGISLITGTARISGYSVGIMACHGKLTENDCIKGSNFIQICGHRNIPIISFVHSVDESLLPNTIDTPLTNEHKVIKAKSSMMRSLATRNCKLITVVIGDAVGVDYICLGGRSMNTDFVFSWPNARFGWRASDLEDVASSSAFKAAGNMAVDDIIEPNNTRMILKTYLDILHTKSNVLSQTQIHPVYRF